MIWVMVRQHLHGFCIGCETQIDVNFCVTKKNSNSTRHLSHRQRKMFENISKGFWIRKTAKKYLGFELSSSGSHPPPTPSLGLGHPSKSKFEEDKFNSSWKTNNMITMAKYMQFNIETSFHQRLRTFKVKIKPLFSFCCLS